MSSEAHTLTQQKTVVNAMKWNDSVLLWKTEATFTVKTEKKSFNDEDVKSFKKWCFLFAFTLTKREVHQRTTDICTEYSWGIQDRCTDYDHYIN